MRKSHNLRDISNRIRNLKIIMDSLFSDQEKKCLSSILSDYKANRNIPYLVDNVHPYLDTKAKEIFIRCLSEIVPDYDQELFRDYCASRGITIQPLEQVSLNKRPSKTNSTYPRTHNWDAYSSATDYEESGGTEIFEEDLWRQENSKDDIPVIRNKPRGHIPRPTVNIDIPSTNLESRHLFVCRLCRFGRQECESFDGCLSTWGINLWRSHSTYSVYVMHIDEMAIYRHNDIFERHIKVGQKLKRINDREVSDIDDDELLEILDSSMNIDLLLQGEGISVECIAEAAGSDYKWIDCSNDRSCSPPVLETLQFDHRRLKPIELIIDATQELGINIRGGGEFNLGIYISLVKSDSVAAIIGLQVGDKLVQINSIGLTGPNTPSHSISMKIINQCREADLWVYKLNRVPLTVDAPNARSKSVGRSGWGYQDSEPQGMFLRGQRSQLTHASLTQPSLETLERQLSDLLSKQDANKVLFLLEKYQDCNINPRQLAVAIHHAINGLWRKKLVLLIMNTLRSNDRFQFHMQLEVIHSALSEKNTSINGECAFQDNASTDTNVGITVTRGRKQPQPFIEEPSIDDSQNPMLVDDFEDKRLDLNTSELRDQDFNTLHRRSSTPDIASPVKSAEGYDVPCPPELESKKYSEEKKEEDHSDVRPPPICHPTNSNHPFKFQVRKEDLMARNRKTNLVTIPKVVAQLGISIEGGVNTPYPLPKIVKIQSNGCVAICGEIQEGDIILEVNGTPLAGMEHSRIARKIAESFQQTWADSIQFLIMKPSLSKQDSDIDDSTDVLYL